MIEKFNRSGVSFQYPTNWELEDEADGDDWVVTLQTPGSALLVITYRDDGPEPAEMADEALEALEDEYEGLEREMAIEKVAGEIAVGYDIDFLTPITAVSAKIRTLDAPEGTLLLFWQVAEKERKDYQPQCDAVLASLALEHLA